MKVSTAQTLVPLLISLAPSACRASGETPRDEAGKVTVAAVESKAVTVTHEYVCQIHAIRHIDIRAPAKGHVAAVPVKEGQAVKRGDVLFRVGPLTDGEKPGARDDDKPFSIKAPFDGMVGRPSCQQGSFVLEGEALTTLSDSSVMWVYFNVPEARYLEYMAEMREGKGSPAVELMLANGAKFPQAGKIGAIEAKFNEQTGNIAFRADFPNPAHLLRHGQTGSVVISRALKGATVVPRRATFEALDRRYVFVVDKDDVAHQREVVIRNELEDLFVVKSGVGAGDKIVTEGVKLVRDGDKVK